MYKALREVEPHFVPSSLLIKQGVAASTELGHDVIIEGKMTVDPVERDRTVIAIERRIHEHCHPAGEVEYGDIRTPEPGKESNFSFVAFGVDPEEAHKLVGAFVHGRTAITSYVFSLTPESMEKARKLLKELPDLLKLPENAPGIGKSSWHIHQHDGFQSLTIGPLALQLLINSTHTSIINHDQHHETLVGTERGKLLVALRAYRKLFNELSDPSNFIATQYEFFTPKVIARELERHFGLGD